MKTKALKKRGRKPLKDKVKPLTIYVKESEIKSRGGAEHCRQQIKKFFTVINNPITL